MDGDTQRVGPGWRLQPLPVSWHGRVEEGHAGNYDWLMVSVASMQDKGGRVLFARDHTGIVGRGCAETD